LVRPKGQADSEAAGPAPAASPAPTGGTSRPDLGLTSGAELSPGRSPRTLAVRTLVITLVGIAVLAAFWATTEVSYLLFHSLVETTVLAVAVVVFAMSWSLRSIVPDSYATLVGLGLLCVALIQLLHLLAYKGMGVFPDADADLPTQLWIAARALTVATFLAAPFCGGGRTMHTSLAVGSFVLVTFLLLATIFWWDVFPACYVEGAGLTTFKVVSEYVIAGGFVVAAGIHVVWPRSLPRSNRLQLIAALLLSAAAEIAFTLYVGVYATPNLIGHLLMLIAVLLVYQALIQGGMNRAYGRLVAQLGAESTALAFLSSHDEMTGLLNRRGFLHTAGTLLSLAAREHRPVALFYADVEDLKKVNDTLGHTAGDALIVTAAEALSSSFRSADVVARIGGDEFAAFTVGPLTENADTVMTRLRDTLASASPPVEGVTEVRVTMGVALADPRETDLDALLSAADADMYRRRAAASAKRERSPDAGDAAGADVSRPEIGHRHAATPADASPTTDDDDQALTPSQS